MGIVVAKVRFNADVPKPPEIQAAVSARTGLPCEAKHNPSSGLVLVTCRKLPASVELSVDDNVVSLEEGVGRPLYFFTQVREALVDLGGCRCDLHGTPRSDGDVPLAREPWASRPALARLADRHPIIVGLLTLVIGVTKELYELVARRIRG